MSSDYRQKYFKYKVKYMELCNKKQLGESLKQIGGLNNSIDYADSIDEDYYVVHSAQNSSNLLEILKSCYIRPGSMIDEGRRIFSGGEPLEYVYGNIQFTDIKNLDRIGSVSLILKPKIIKEYGVIFNQGWFKSPTDMSIYIHKDDPDLVKDKKILEIKEYVANPTYYKNSPIALSFTGVMAHELLFNEPISLKENLIGILCSGCPKEDLKKIRKVMDNKYPSSKFFS